MGWRGGRYLGDFRNERIIWIRISQERADGEKNLRGKGRKFMNRKIVEGGNVGD
jgi:hypothetical protein